MVGTALRRTTLALLVALSMTVGHPALGHAKEYEVDGIVDCGLRSGQRCDIDDVLVLRTEDVSGTLERIEINVKWIRKSLPKLEQDDHVMLLVEDMPRGGLRALSVAEIHNVEGTINPGLSTAGRKVSEQPRREKDGHDDDHDNTGYGGQTPPGIPIFLGSCDNKVSGGSDCAIVGFDLIGAQIGGTPTFSTRTKVTTGSPSVLETFSCTPTAGDLSTSCVFISSGRLYQNSPGQISYPLAGGGTGVSVELFFNCGEADGVVCPNVIP